MPLLPVLLSLLFALFSKLSPVPAAEDPAARPLVMLLPAVAAAEKTADEPDPKPDPTPKPPDPEPGANVDVIRLDAPAGEAGLPGVGTELPRFHCHSADEARKLLEDESWFPFHSGATADAVRFALGLRAADPVPADQAALARFSREGFRNMALDFTPSERALLEKAVAALRRELGAEWPLLGRLPWHFIKVRKGFCDDLPHTRGMAIVLSEPALAMQAEEPDLLRFVLFHEKMHIVQRLYPGRFSELYEKYGYFPMKLAAGEAARAGLAVNPDAPEHGFRIEIDGLPVLLALVLKEEDGRLSVAEGSFRLKEDGEGLFRIAGPQAAGPVDLWLDRCPIRKGYEHPNETSAYLANILLDLRRRGRLVQAQDNAMLQATLDAMPEIMRVDEAP